MDKICPEQGFLCIFPNYLSFYYVKHINTGLEFIAAAGIIPCVILSGIWLRIKGKPYNTAIFTLHKLLTVGAIWLLIKTLVRADYLSYNSFSSSWLPLLTAIIFIITFATGVMQSFSRNAPPSVNVTHKVTPYLVMILLAIIFIDIFNHNINY
jgi:hypothetical protein